MVYGMGLGVASAGKGGDEDEEEEDDSLAATRTVDAGKRVSSCCSFLIFDVQWSSLSTPLKKSETSAH